MHTYIHTRIHTYTYIRINTYTYIRICIHMYMYTFFSSPKVTCHSYSLHLYMYLSGTTTLCLSTSLHVPISSCHRNRCASLHLCLSTCTLLSLYVSASFHLCMCPSLPLVHIYESYQFVLIHRTTCALN